MDLRFYRTFGALVSLNSPRNTPRGRVDAISESRYLASFESMEVGGDSYDESPAIHHNRLGARSSEGEERVPPSPSWLPRPAPTSPLSLQATRPPLARDVGHDPSAAPANALLAPLSGRPPGDRHTLAGPGAPGSADGPSARHAWPDIGLSRDILGSGDHAAQAALAAGVAMLSAARAAPEGPPFRWPLGNGPSAGTRRKKWPGSLPPPPPPSYPPHHRHLRPGGHLRMRGMRPPRT